MSELLQLTRKQLDELFAVGESGPIPSGPASGLAIIFPGTVVSGAIANFVRMFAWQGKSFDGQAGSLVNRISPVGFGAIKARVYEDASWFDGKPCIVLDYSKTSTLAWFIRDEIRAIGPRLYLGKVYFGRIPTFGFALKF
jgi:hypothetical protein